MPAHCGVRQKGTGGGLGEARVSPLSSSLSLLGPVAVVSTLLGMSIYRVS